VPVLMVSLLTISSVDAIPPRMNNRSLSYIDVTARMEELVLKKTDQVKSSVDVDQTSKEMIAQNTFREAELVLLVQATIHSSLSSSSLWSSLLQQPPSQFSRKRNC
jgi:hypothetical protein